MPYETILAEVRGGVGIITFNRPDKLNALSTVLTVEFYKALGEMENDDSVKWVVITGSGEKAFSAGADIHEMSELPEATLKERNANAAERNWYLANYPKPTIGAINGLAFGGGAFLASALDIRIGCDHTSFRFLGINYKRVNSTWTLPLIVGWPLAKEYLFTGRIVPAEEAYRTGLLNRLVSASGLMKTAMELGREIASKDNTVVQGIKEILNGHIGMSMQQMMEHEIEVVNRSIRTPPPKERFKDFLDKKRRG